MLHVDVLLKDAQVYSSVYKQFFKNSIAIKGDKILYVGNDALDQLHCQTVLECHDQWIIPGLIDIHLHIESSMVTPLPFSQALLAHGVTSCVAEAHEIANVFGKEGVEHFMQTARESQADIFFAAPSSVPSTALEHTGASIDADECVELIKSQKLPCLGEVMDCRSLLHDPDGTIGHLVQSVQQQVQGAIIEGHCPRFMGLELAEILYHGVDSDHTLQNRDTIRARVENGMFVEIQEKSITKENIAYLNEVDFDEHFCLVTDDVMADDFKHGHLMKLVRKAVKTGMPVEKAIYAATKSPANRMKMTDRGFIAPGRIADLVLLSDLQNLTISRVYKSGQWVQSMPDVAQSAGFPAHYYQSVHLKPRTIADFEVEVSPDATAARCVVMSVDDASTFTKQESCVVAVKDGKLDIENTDGVALVKVFERHHETGFHATGLAGGCCLNQGAVATTYAHDHHNLMVVGKSKSDMMLAANTVIQNQGGICVVKDGKVLGDLPLPVAGIVSERAVDAVGADLACVTDGLRALGWKNLNPIMSLCTMSLPVSPAVKITDMGLVDVREGKLIDFVQEIII